MLNYQRVSYYTPIQSDDFPISHISKKKPIESQFLSMYDIGYDRIQNQLHHIYIYIYTIPFYLQFVAFF